MPSRELLKLDKHNISMIEGYLAAKSGKSLEDLFSLNEESNDSLREGYRKGMQKLRNNLTDAIAVFSNQPTPENFQSVTSALENVDSDLYLKSLASFAPLVPNEPTGSPTLTIEYWLNRLLSEEFQAWYQYFIVKDFLKGNERTEVEEVFDKNADDELYDHAKALLNRLKELGFSSSWLSESPKSWDSYASSPYTYPTTDVREALSIMVESEYHAIGSYTEAVAFAVQANDYVTEDLFKRILADEQAHVSELQRLVNDI